MAIINIALLHFQQVFHHRLRSFVWFLIPLLNNLILILFWRGALSHTAAGTGWTMPAITAYYFLLTIAGSLLSSHIEEDVALYDIQYGELTKYLTRPFPYYWIKFIEEIPYRILQGFYGVILVILFTFFFGTVVRLSSDPVIVLSCLIMCVLAFFLSFTLKMNLGMSAFWFKDSRGFFELITIVMIVFSGGIIPIHFLPTSLKTLSYALPFAYTAYFPIMAIQGQYSYLEVVRLIGMQALWLAVLVLFNRFLWREGIKQFTAFGQ